MMTATTVSHGAATARTPAPRLARVASTILRRLR
jgi:hypothetical protein